jgi:hypothetical protein
VGTTPQMQPPPGAPPKAAAEIVCWTSEEWERWHRPLRQSARDAAQSARDAAIARTGRRIKGRANARAKRLDAQEDLLRAQCQRCQGKVKRY